MNSQFVLFLISFLWTSPSVDAQGNDDDGDKIAWMVYQPLAVNLTCFRKLNGTGEVGCGSSRHGNVGVVHIIQSNETLKEDLEWILHKGTSPPYSVGVDLHLVTTELVEKLASSGRVNGLSLFHVREDGGSDALPLNYTEDHASPNFRSGLYKPGDRYFGYNWIPIGKSISWRNWNLPIAIMQDKKSRYELVHSCYEQFNRAVANGTSSGPVCAVEFLSRMYAAKDAPTCLRRTQQTYFISPSSYDQCHPLQSYSIHSPLVARDKADFKYQNRSVTVLSVRLDTTSMFEHVGVAADSVVTSLVSFMAIAGALHRFEADFLKQKETVYLFLMNGESYDYIGSSRIIRDMAERRFPNDTSFMEDWTAPPPLQVQHIKRWIELDQIGTGDSSTLFVHSDPLSQRANATVKDLIKQMKDKLNAAGKGAGLNIVDAHSDETGLPPSSLQRFLREDLNIAGVVLSGYDKAFVNPFYHSFKETPEYTLNYKCGVAGREGNQAVIKRLIAVSETVSAAVFDLIVGQPKTVPVDGTKVAEMLDCYLCNSNCSLFYNISIREYRPRLQEGVPFPLYTSVGSIAGFVYDVVIFTKRLLVSLIGKEVEKPHEQCIAEDKHDIYSFDWFAYPDNRTSCIMSTVAFRSALSPAFDSKGYDWKSGNYSTWVESFTGLPTARIFLLPSKAQELTTLLVGIFVTLLWFVVALFCVRRREVIYSPSN